MRKGKGTSCHLSLHFTHSPFSLISHSPPHHILTPSPLTQTITHLLSPSYHTHPLTTHTRSSLFSPIHILTPHHSHTLSLPHHSHKLTHLLSPSSHPHSLTTHTHSSLFSPIHILTHHHLHTLSLPHHSHAHTNTHSHFTVQ